MWAHLFEMKNLSKWEKACSCPKKIAISKVSTVQRVPDCFAVLVIQWSIGVINQKNLSLFSRMWCETSDIIVLSSLCKFRRKWNTLMGSVNSHAHHKDFSNLIEGTIFSPEEIIEGELLLFVPNERLLEFTSPNRS